MRRKDEKSIDCVSQTYILITLFYFNETNESPVKAEFVNILIILRVCKQAKNVASVNINQWTLCNQFDRCAVIFRSVIEPGVQGQNLIITELHRYYITSQN